MADLVISYARKDRHRVRAIVALLRAHYPSQAQHAVFWDDDFVAGEDWFVQFCAAIDAAPQLFVFWCSHASASSQVEREFIYAQQRGRRVVPVLLDNTALPKSLSPVHGVDLRGIVRHTHPLIQPLTLLLALAASLTGLWGITYGDSSVASDIMRMIDTLLAVDAHFPRIPGVLFISPLGWVVLALVGLVLGLFALYFHLRTARQETVVARFEPYINN